jgi:hypothetical protein
MRPAVRVSEVAVYISWDNGRSWWSMGSDGSAFQQFRVPPNGARTLHKDGECRECRGHDCMGYGG